MFHGSSLSVISDCLRGFLVPKEGHDFIACDFSAIEARVVAWLADEKRVLDIFLGHGQIYEDQAARIYGVALESVTKDQRQIGKVAVLALGFGGGVGAFQAMAKNLGVKVSDEEAEGIKQAWRAANPNIVRYWSQLEAAAKAAVLSPNVIKKAGPSGRQVSYIRVGSFLWCKLPSSRVLCYPYPQINACQTPWGETKDMITYMTEDAMTRKWTRVKTYGGSFGENCTQAVARDLLAAAMLRLEAANYPVAMHIHDEAVCEVPKDFGSIDEMKKIFELVPAWAIGLPIKAEGWRGDRYRK